MTTPARTGNPPVDWDTATGRNVAWSVELGKDTFGRPPHVIAQLGMSRTFQNIRLFREMTCVDNVLVGMHTKLKGGLGSTLLRLPSQRREEREIRGCAVHACELVSERTGIPARHIDTALWNRGQAPRYKSVPRHRCRTVFY